MKLIDKNAAAIAGKKVCKDMLDAAKVLTLVVLSCSLVAMLMAGVLHGLLGMMGETAQFICWIIGAIVSLAILLFFIEYDVARESMQR